MNLPSIDVEDVATKLNSYDSGVKRQAKDKLTKFVIAANLLNEKFEAVQEAATEISRENVRLRLENEGMKNQVPSALTASDLWNLETAILTGVEKIFSRLSESTYQPVVKTGEPAPRYSDLVSKYEYNTGAFVDDLIDIHEVESARGPGWFEANCNYILPGGIQYCSWTTSGTESVVEDAAHEHAQKHIDDAKAA